MSADEFSKLVFNISQQLTPQNIEALTYIYGIVAEKASNLHILRILESRGEFSSRNIEGLKDVLKNIQRCDLLDKIKYPDEGRLELCYIQAISIEKQLASIRDDLLDFCSKQECSPTERLFCSKISERVEKVQSEAKSFLIQPLSEMQQRRKSNEEKPFLARPGSRPASSKQGGNFSKMSHSSTHILKSQQARGPYQVSATPKVYQNTSHLQQMRSHPAVASESDYDNLCPLQSKQESSQLVLDVDESRAHYFVGSNLETQHNSHQHHSKQKHKLSEGSITFPLNIRLGDRVHETNSGNSVPTTPSVQRKLSDFQSRSVDNLLGGHQGSNIPVLRKKTSLPKSTESTRSSESSLTRSGDIEASHTSGTGDSGFSDPTEFLRETTDQRSSLSQEHIYTTPNKFTNAPNIYSVPKRDFR